MFTTEPAIKASVLCKTVQLWDFNRPVVRTTTSCESLLTMPPKASPGKAASKSSPPKTTAAKSTAKKPTNTKTEMKPATEDNPIEKPDEEIVLKDMAKILFAEVSTLKESGRWALLIDPTERASTFLRYRDCNYVNTLDPSHMQTDRLRLALLGALWFGKPMVLDMGDADMMKTVAEKLDEVEKGLMDSIMDKSIINEERILKLVKKEDGPEYEAIRIDETRFKNFQLIIIMSGPPKQSLGKRMYVIQIN